MTQQESGTGPSTEVEPKAADDVAARVVSVIHGNPVESRSKPTRTLPTNRVAFAKQLDILRAYAIASGPAGDHPVKTQDVAGIVRLNRGTVQLVNSWLGDVGLIQRTDGGYLPASEVTAFNRAWAWERETAAFKLGPLLSRAWFAELVLPKMSLHPMEEAQAVVELGDAVSAGPEYRPQLMLLIDFMEVAGLVVRDGGMLRLRDPSAVTAVQPQTEDPKSAPPEARQDLGRNVSTSFSKDVEGVVQFNVSVRVRTSEFSGWKADRIAAFFGGIAQVLAAKSGIEDEEGGTP
jgi:hypothetical protein